MSDAAAAVPSRLVSARTARGLSVAQVAGQMRLAPEVVTAMEEERYADLGPAVFARGHLRKYATLLGVPVEQVLADYDGSSSRAAESSLIPPASAHTPVRAHGRSRRPGRLTGVLVAAAVLAAVAAAGWWYWQARAATGATAAAITAPEEVTAAGAAPGAMAALPDPAVVAEASPEGTLVPAAAGQAPQAGSGPGRLALQFSGPCWTEVYDADGRRLAFELAEAGAAMSFDGPAPWRVVLGNADSARVTLDGAALDIPATLMVRDAALLLVGDDGTLAPAPAGGDGQ